MARIDADKKALKKLEAAARLPTHKTVSHDSDAKVSNKKIIGLMIMRNLIRDSKQKRIYLVIKNRQKPIGPISFVREAGKPQFEPCARSQFRGC